MTVEELFASSGGGAPIYFNKDSRIGDSVEGEIVDAKAREARDFENPSVIKTWDDGSPQMQLIVTLQTNRRDPWIEDDDGKRRVFLRWYGTDKKATEDAVAKAGDRFVQIGAWMRVTYTGLAEPVGRLNPARIYGVEYRAASSVETLMTKEQTPQYAPASASANYSPPAAQAGQSAGAVARSELEKHADELARQRGAVSDARQTQQSAAADGGDRRAQIEKVQKLVRAGFAADEIAGMVTISREAIEAIVATVS